MNSWREGETAKEVEKEKKNAVGSKRTSAKGKRLGHAGHYWKKIQGNKIANKRTQNPAAKRKKKNYLHEIEKGTDQERRGGSSRSH